MSSPNTQCPQGPPLPANVFESADDLEDLRLALGAGKLSLIAHSYGTSLALATVRRHGEHLDRIVLSGVEGPDEGLQLPYTFEFAFRKLSLLAARNAAFPDTWQQFQKLVKQMAQKPVTLHLRTGQPDQTADFSAGAFLLQFAIKTMLPNGSQADRIPALVYSLSSGDTLFLTAFAQNFYDGLTTGATAMSYAVMCSDSWSAGRRQIAEEQAANSAIGEASFMQLDARVCADLKTTKPLVDSFLPIWSQVPALLLTGTLDSNMPVHQAEEVLESLPNGISITVENGFHEVLPSPDVQSVVVDFLSGADVKQRTLHFDPPQFLSIEEARKTPQR
jgi:pimeloyl-ACP methyl ester carboxylesterase